MSAPAPRSVRPLEALSVKVTGWVGTSAAFAAALAVVLLWALTGPFFRFGETWQLVINTGTTIVTFLMVFLIQRAQNKESKAIHLKLDEILAAIDGASNRLIDAEALPEVELNALARQYSELSRAMPRTGRWGEARSIEDTHDPEAEPSSR